MKHFNSGICSRAVKVFGIWLVSHAVVPGAVAEMNSTGARSASWQLSYALRNDTNVSKLIISPQGANTVSLDDYRHRLEEKEAYLRQHLGDQELSRADFSTLKIALTQVQSKLSTLTDSHRAYLNDIQHRVASLRALQGEVKQEDLQFLQAALQQGDTRKAQQKLRHLLLTVKLSPAAAAELEFQLGKLASDDARYYDALQRFERAAKKQPQNLLYVGEAAYVAGTLGLHRKELRLERKALKIALLTYDKHSPEIAARHNNLGSAYQSLSNHAKAINHYRLALQSGLRTYGEQHPKVALRRNNLAMAYQYLGEHETAIRYFKKALAVFETSLGETHPNTLAVADNLAHAQLAQKKSKLSQSSPRH